MGILISEDTEFDDSSIQTAIDLKLSLEIVTHSLPKKTHEYMDIMLSKYLDECGMSAYYNKLSFCLSEILFNSIKANMKRIYFAEKNLDINNPSDYEKGMINFRTETLSNKSHYFEKLREKDLYVLLSLCIESGNLIIEVRNNSLITETEYQRVKEKFAEFRNPEELAATDIKIDESEGAGLGIKTVLLALESFGLPGDHYQLFTQGDETIARLIIENNPVSEIEELSELDELEEL